MIQNGIDIGDPVTHKNEGGYTIQKIRQNGQCKIDEHAGLVSIAGCA